MMRAGFLTVREAVTRKEWRETSVNPVVLDWSRGFSVDSLLRMYIKTDRQRHNYIYVCTHGRYIFFLLLVRQPSNSDIPLAMSMLSTPILISKYHSLINGTRTPWRSGWFQGKYKMSWRSCGNKKEKNYSNKDPSMSKGTGANLEELPKPKLE